MRLPTDVFERIEARAKGEGRPFHRIIVDELALFPHLFRQARLGELVRDMETVLARYGSRITVTEVNEALLHAVDEALAARTDGQLQAQLDRLRVIRRICSKANGGPQRMRANSSPVARPPRAARQSGEGAARGRRGPGGSRRAQG